MGWPSAFGTVRHRAGPSRQRPGDAKHRRGYLMGKNRISHLTLQRVEKCADRIDRYGA